MCVVCDICIHTYKHIRNINTYIYVHGLRLVCCDVCLCVCVVSKNCDTSMGETHNVCVIYTHTHIYIQACVSGSGEFVCACVV